MGRKKGIVRKFTRQGGGGVEGGRQILTISNYTPIESVPPYY